MLGLELVAESAAPAAPATDSHRMGGTDARARRHRRHMGRERDERSRRAGPGALRGNEDHDRDPGCEHRLDDVLRGRNESARRVELDHEGGCAGILGFRDRGHQVVGDGRVDAARDGGHVHGRGSGPCPGGESRPRNEQGAAAQREK